MRTYFKNLNIGTYLGLMLTIGLTTISCTSVNSNYYDTDGIYNTGKVKAPKTHNETAYYEEYFNEKKNTSYETFTDIDSYSSYENGSYPGWGENNSNTNIYLNFGYNNPYWGWNNYYPSYGWNWGFGYNNYFGWDWNFGFGGYYGWGYPYYGGSWSYPYYGYYSRNVSRTSNTRTIANNYRNSNSLSNRKSNNLNRSNRTVIENSRSSANRLDPRSNTNMRYKDAKTSDLRNSSIRNSNIRTNETRQNTRTINNSYPTRNTNYNSTPTRSSSPAPRMGGSSSGGRISTGRR